MFKNKLVILSVIGLFIILVVIYFRHVLFTGSEVLLTNHLATDIYGHFIHVSERLNLLKDGFLPLGDYWVIRGGGYPAASNDQLLDIHELMLMGGYVITGNLALVYKMLIPVFYLATALMSYWFGLVLFKRKDAGIFLAVAYTFCLYGANQIEHIELIGIQPLILFTLIFFEKSFLDLSKKRFLVFMALGLTLVFISNLYALYFLAVYIAFRLIYMVFTTKDNVLVKRIMFNIGSSFLLVLLFTIPLFIPQFIMQPPEMLKNFLISQHASYSRPMYEFFIRNIGYEPYVTEIFHSYLGYTLLAVAFIVPIFIKRGLDKTKLEFYWVVTLFFMVWAVGNQGGVNINSFMPFSYFIQVPGRAMMIACLGLAICGTLGFMAIRDKIKGNIKGCLFSFAVIVVIFADLTIGFEPSTMKPYFNENDKVYQYLNEIEDDGRVVEIPSVLGQQALSQMFTGHDTLNGVLWAYGHFEPLWTIVEIPKNYVKFQDNAMESSMYGIKYIVLKLDEEYYEEFHKVLELDLDITRDKILEVKSRMDSNKDYRLIYNDEDNYIYENTLYRGLVFADNAEIEYEYVNNNRLVIEVVADKETDLIISQSYCEGWNAELNGQNIDIQEYNALQVIHIPKGSSHIIMNYDNHVASLIVIFSFWLVGILLIIFLLKRFKIVSYIVGFWGIVLIVYSTMFYPYVVNPLYQYSLTVLGLLCLVFAIFIFIKGRLHGEKV